MALLDALTYIIDSDSSKLKSDIDQSKQTTEKLNDALDKTEKQAKKAGMSWQTIAKASMGYLATVLSVSAAISSANERSKFIEGVRETSDAIGSAVEDVDAFGKSIERMGGDVSAAQSTLTGLSTSVKDSLNDVNSASAKTFSSLGVHLKDAAGKTKGTIDVMLELSDAVAGMDRAQAMAKLSTVGITDQKSIEQILKGRQEMERMMRAQKESGVITKEAAENSRQYSQAMAQIDQGLKKISDGFSDWFMPVINKVLNVLKVGVDWLSENQNVVRGFFAAITLTITAMYLPAMIKAAAATLAAVSPFLLIGAAIVAASALFALIYDDIMAFIDGNDSLIGQIFEKYPMVAKIVQGMGDVFIWLKDTVVGAFMAIWEAAKSAFSFIMGGYEKVAGVVGKIGSFLGFGGGDVDVNVKKAQGDLATASASPLNSVTSSAISNTSNSTKETNVQVGQVTVQTQATDARGIGNDIGSELRGQLKNLQTESATGVAR